MRTSIALFCLLFGVVSATVIAQTPQFAFPKPPKPSPPTPPTTTGVAFQQGGNAFGTIAVLGTTDNNALEIEVHGGRVMRYEPMTNGPNVVGGSSGNGVESGLWGATIAGGGLNQPTCDNINIGVISCANQVTGDASTIGGGFANDAGGPFGGDTVAGGEGNVAVGGLSSIGGGAQNHTNGNYSTIGGGSANQAYGEFSTVAGGSQNTADGEGSTVCGGESNYAGETGNTIIGGSGNRAIGGNATVLGGTNNAANAPYSVVMGFSAATGGGARGSFVFSDTSDNGGLQFGTDYPNQFVVAASGGVQMVTDKMTLTGCSIAAGSGSWSCTSSRDVKRDFDAVDPAVILAKVSELPVMRWRYMNEPVEVRHIGTFAQDFRAAFGLGIDDKSIASVDAEGIAMAAIKGLNAKLEAAVQSRDAEIADLKQRLERLEARSR